jgi:hypothetical protein
VDSLVEEVIEEQVLELGVGTVAGSRQFVSLLFQVPGTYAFVMSLRKTERMMQPPRHMSAISGLLSFQLYSFAAWALLAFAWNRLRA